MMPGPHIPPAVPSHPSRRQSDYPPYMPPQQTHSPAHNPYAHYPPPHHGYPHAPPQWYYPPQHHYPPPPHYPSPQHGPPRHYMPHPQHFQQPQFHQQGPVVVSSNPQVPHIQPMSRQPEKSPAPHTPQHFERQFVPPPGMQQEMPQMPAPVPQQPPAATSPEPPMSAAPSASSTMDATQSAVLPPPSQLETTPPLPDRRIPWYPTVSSYTLGLGAY